jgi:hypothetical protein
MDAIISGADIFPPIANIKHLMNLNYVKKKGNVEIVF